MNDTDMEEARAACRAELAKPPSQGAADRGWAAAAKIIREAERKACAEAIEGIFGGSCFLSELIRARGGE